MNCARTRGLRLYFLPLLFFALTFSSFAAEQEEEEVLAQWLPAKENLRKGAMGCRRR